MAGENIYGLFTLQHPIHHTTWVMPIIEDQDRLLCFKHKSAMEDVGQRHLLMGAVNLNVADTDKAVGSCICDIYSHISCFDGSDAGIGNG